MHAHFLLNARMTPQQYAAARQQTSFGCNISMCLPPRLLGCLLSRGFLLAVLLGLLHQCLSSTLYTYLLTDLSSILLVPLVPHRRSLLDKDVKSGPTLTTTITKPGGTFDKTSGIGGGQMVVTKGKNGRSKPILIVNAPVIASPFSDSGKGRR